MREVDAPWTAAALSRSKISVSCFFEPNRFGTSCFCGGFARPSLTGGRSANLSSMRRWAAGAQRARIAFSFSGNLQAEASSSSEELSILSVVPAVRRGGPGALRCCALHKGVFVCRPAPSPVQLRCSAQRYRPEQSLLFKLRPRSALGRLARARVADYLAACETLAFYKEQSLQNRTSVHKPVVEQLFIKPVVHKPQRS